MPEISLFKLDATASETRNVDVVSDFETLDHMAQAISSVPWAPGIFKDKLRANKNLERIDLLVLDVDEGCTLSDALKLFAGYKHIIGTSKSHGVDKNGVTCDRFRVILFLSNSATSDAEFKAAWFAAFNKWPFIDRACKDSARFFFPCSAIVSINEAGDLFSERYELPVTSSVQRATSSAQRGKLSKATKDFLAEGAGPGEWHGRFFKAAMDFKEQGYDIETARLKLSAVTGELDATDEQQLVDVYENRAAKYGPRGNGGDLVISDWPDVIVDAEGNARKRNSEENVKHLLKKLGYDLSFNEMDNAIYTNGERTLTDEDIAYTWTRCDRYGLPTKKERFMALLLTFACERRFHPIKEVIERAPWDGADHIAKLFETIRVSEGDKEWTELYKTFLSKWLVGIVAKIYRPGSQNLVLTLQGPQGYGKSRWFARFALWHKGFGEGAIDPSNKDHEIRHLTNLIWHIPELDSTTSKREAGALKDYLTKDYVAVRPAWARTVRHGRSVCSFAASVNQREFLVDQTGNRRFLVIPIADIDADHKGDMQQVFAQAKAMLEAGYQYWMSRAEMGALNENNEAFELRDAIVEYAEAVQEGDEEMTVNELLEAFRVIMPTHAQISRFGAVLAKRGFKKVRGRYGQIRKQVYKVRNPAKLQAVPSIVGPKKYDV